MAKHYILNAGTVNFNISPFGFYQYAKQYYLAGMSWEDNSNYSPVPYFLFCRSIELGFKSFLLVKGCSINIIKNKIGHDLVLALQSANQYLLTNYLVTTATEKKELLKANRYYKTKGFEYFMVTNHVNGKSICLI